MILKEYITSPYNPHPPHTQPESNYILTFRNEDRPGVISEVLQVLNNANVNVASLNVTRAGAGQVSLDRIGGH